MVPAHPERGGKGCPGHRDGTPGLGRVGSPQAARVLHLSGIHCTLARGCKVQTLTEYRYGQDDYKYLSSDDQLASQGMRHDGWHGMRMAGFDERCISH